MTAQGSRTSGRAPGSTSMMWATGTAMFAGVVLLVSGVFGFVEGLSAVLKDKVYVVTTQYAYQLDVTTWGWIHLVLGLLAAAVGVAIIMRQSWALVAGIVVACFTALANFMFLPYYPFWAIVLIAIDIAVIWALTQLYSAKR